jgi:hypothetical protein
MAISETDKIRIISAYERLKNITEVSGSLRLSISIERLSSVGSGASNVRRAFGSVRKVAGLCS